MESAAFSNDKFKQILLEVHRTNGKKAHQFAVKTITHVKNMFSNASPEEKVEYINFYYKSVLILKELSKKQNCFSCTQKHYNAAFRTLARLHNSKEEPAQLRIESGILLKSIYHEQRSFYEMHSKQYELSLLNSKFKESYKHLISL